MEYRRGRKNNCALNKIFQFADVAGPMVAFEGGDGLRGNRFDVPVHPASITLGKIPNQRGDVFGALPQRGNRKGKNIQPVKEIAAEFPVLDHAGKVAVRGGHQPDIHAPCARATESFKLLFLQNAQELRLKFGRNVCDLVEKERPPVRELESPQLLSYCPSKGASFVSEELGFEQSGGNRGAIDFHERAVPARTEIVKGPGDQLFTRASLSQDQHG